MKVELLPGNSMTMTITEKGLTLEVEDKPKSAHKAGEPFEGYTGFSEIEPEWFYARSNMTAQIVITYTVRHFDEPKEILRPRTVRRNAHPVKESEPKYEVGQIVKLKGCGGLPDGEYKILEIRLPRTGDSTITTDSRNHLFASANDEDFDLRILNNVSDIRYIVAPMPSTSWYDFEIEGVKCRAYQRTDGKMIHVVSEYGLAFCWLKGYDGFLDNILDAIDARLKAERGEGIRVIPYAVSNGVFEPPERGEIMCSQDRTMTKEEKIQQELDTMSEMYRAACRALRENSKPPDACPCIPTGICEKCKGNPDNYNDKCWDRYIHYKLYEAAK